MLATKIEEELLFSYLKSDTRALEYGSGRSTIEISAKVKTLVSVEHNLKWYNKTKGNLPSNVTYLYVPPDLPWRRGKEDGTFEQFKSYVISPLPYAPFDIVFIDGRAREACCRYINDNASHSNTLFFIHDFSYTEPVRAPYLKCLEYMEIVKYVDRMAVFKKRR